MPTKGDRSNGGDRREEGTLSPEELETQNFERAYGLTVEVQGDAEITVVDGGDGSPIEVNPKGAESSVERIFDQYYNGMRMIIAMLIILMVLVVVALVLWRLSMLTPLLKLLAAVT